MVLIRKTSTFTNSFYSIDNFRNSWVIVYFLPDLSNLNLHFYYLDFNVNLHSVYQFVFFRIYSFLLGKGSFVFKHLGLGVSNVIINVLLVYIDEKGTFRNLCTSVCLWYKAIETKYVLQAVIWASTHFWYEVAPAAFKIIFRNK